MAYRDSNNNTEKLQENMVSGWLIAYLQIFLQIECGEPDKENTNKKSDSLYKISKMDMLKVPKEEHTQGTLV